MTGSNSQYVSPWLIHWTARTGGDEVGLANLTAIVETGMLKLSDNRIIKTYFSIGVKTRMVCFTDVPLQFSAKHCARYGRFGIAFSKRRLILKGAQPVFYVALGCRENVKHILNFLLSTPPNSHIPEGTLAALEEHFCFVQEFSEGSIDAEDAYYYEREWRLALSTLAPEDLWQLDNAKYHIKKAGYPANCGKLVVRDGEHYFAFDDEDVSFLVCPEAYASRVQNTRGYELRLFEKMVTQD